jgi:LuxR family maltose regulon positive regulatory protein
MITVALAGRLRYWLAQGKPDAAARWLDAKGISVEATISPGDLAYHVLLARVLVDQGRLTMAQRQLERLAKIMEERESPRFSIELFILQALLYQATGDGSRAETTLMQALQLAEPEGYLRLFVDHGESIIPLLEQVAGRRSAPPNLKAILSIVREEQRVTEKPPPTAGRSPRTFVPFEPLKDQELQILRLMAAGLSNREIADELFLSVNTIKVYASRIYGKLGVHRRGEAVARAQELDLI